MKKYNFYYLVVALSFIVLNGCSSNQPAEETTQSVDQEQVVADVNAVDYSGIYISNKTGVGCNLTITITKENNAYKYALTGEHYDQEGIAIIEKTDAVYITFDGPIGNNEPKKVSGQIQGNKITIQNYGNSMNEYHFFVDCDEKFMEFVK